MYTFFFANTIYCCASCAAFSSSSSISTISISSGYVRSAAIPDNKSSSVCSISNDDKLTEIPTMTRFMHCTEDKYFSTTQFPNVLDHFYKSLTFCNIL